MRLDLVPHWFFWNSPVKISKKSKPDPSTVKGLRKERRIIKGIAEELLQTKVSMDNSRQGTRRKIIHQLFSMAADPKRKRVLPDLAKAALEIYSYNDSFAVMLLRHIADEDYTNQINHAKTLEELESS